MIEYRTLRQQELERWYDHCVTAFNKGVIDVEYRQYFENHYENDLFRDLESIFVAMDGETIASTIRVFYRKVYLQGQEISMGGIGEVCTQPEYRKLGLSSRLLTMAIDKMEKEKIVVSMLGTGIQRHYAKQGWQDSIFNGKMGILPLSQGTLSLYKARVVDFDRDMEAVELLYKAYSGSCNGPVVRDHTEYWEQWIRCEWRKAWVLEKQDGSIVAYVVIEEQEDALQVKEYGACRSDGLLFDELLYQVCKFIGRMNLMVQVSSGVASHMSIQKTFMNKGWMLRLVTPFMLGSRTITSTEQLMQAFLDPVDQELPHYVFWGTDGF